MALLFTSLCAGLVMAQGTLTATVGEKTAFCNLDKGHKIDGAAFNRFGIMNVMKSADPGGEAWFDDVTFNGRRESFDKDPNWEGKNNRKSWTSTIVRPRFDFGFSPTQFADGKGKGELGGMIFRGDCRYSERMACYGEPIGPLTLDKPFQAAGKMAVTHGVTDSTVLFGFYNSEDSMRVNSSQSDGEEVRDVHPERSFSARGRKVRRAQRGGCMIFSAGVGDDRIDAA